MKRYTTQTLVAWLLVWGHLALVVAGPMGLLVCRDGSGSSHIEWTAAKCCSDQQAATGERHPGTPDAYSDAYSAFCSAAYGDCTDGDCIDQPVSHEPFTAEVRSARLGSDFWVPVVPGDLRGWFVDPPNSSIELAARPGMDAGPSRQVVCCLSSTILIV